MVGLLLTLVSCLFRISVSRGVVHPYHRLSAVTGILRIIKGVDLFLFIGPDRVQGIFTNPSIEHSAQFYGLALPPGRRRPGDRLQQSFVHWSAYLLR